MKRTALALLLTAGFSTFALPTSAEPPATDAWTLPVEKYGLGDPNIDVLAALNEHGPILLAEYKSAQGVCALYWDEVEQKLTVFNPESGVKYLTEMQFDQFGRPHFAAFSSMPDSKEEVDPMLTGFLDRSPEGWLMIQLEVVGDEPVRLLALQGKVMAKKVCVCYGQPAKNKGDCEEDDCDVAKDCDTSGAGGLHCKWVYKLDANPIITAPGG